MRYRTINGIKIGLGLSEFLASKRKLSAFIRYVKANNGGALGLNTIFTGCIIHTPRFLRDNLIPEAGLWNEIHREYMAQPLRLRRGAHLGEIAPAAYTAYFETRWTNTTVDPVEDPYKHKELI